MPSTSGCGLVPLNISREKWSHALQSPEPRSKPAHWASLDIATLRVLHIRVRLPTVKSNSGTRPYRLQSLPFIPLRGHHPPFATLDLLFAPCMQLRPGPKVPSGLLLLPSDLCLCDGPLIPWTPRFWPHLTCNDLEPHDGTMAWASVRDRSRKRL